MRDGILVLKKPRNWTSSDCVAVCRRVLGVKGIKKVGHGGTLDPMATGVLPIFVGQATRTMEYMDLDFKTYACEAKLGITTDTLDIWGEIQEEHDWKELNLSAEGIAEALKDFEGLITQMPPVYSAVRIDGKRLYEYAHKGQELSDEVKSKIKVRKAYIKHISINRIDVQAGKISFDIECSKGTYIRTICSDLGEKLTCGCTMTALERTAVGNIRIEQALITAEQVKTMTAEELEALLLPIDYPLIYLGKVFIATDRADYFRRGNSIRWSQVDVVEKPDIEALQKSGRTCSMGDTPRNARGRSYATLYRVYEKGSNQFLGTGYYDKNENLLKADKVFAERRYESI